MSKFCYYTIYYTTNKTSDPGACADFEGRVHVKPRALPIAVISKYPCVVISCAFKGADSPSINSTVSLD